MKKWSPENHLLERLRMRYFLVWSWEWINNPFTKSAGILMKKDLLQTVLPKFQWLTLQQWVLLEMGELKS